MGMIKDETIRRLIRIVEESQIDELEVSRWGTRVKITRKKSRENSHPDATSAPAAFAPALTTAGGNHLPAAPPAPAEPAPDADAHLTAIKSPMVGTFYASPAPGQPPFVTANDRVTVGQVVCIIEAMKLMNEIHSEIEGRVVKILTGSGQPVEYGQTLFMIDPKG